MTKAQKSNILSKDQSVFLKIVGVFLLAIGLFSCKKPAVAYQSIDGKYSSMNYHVSFKNDSSLTINRGIDSIFTEISKQIDALDSLSTTFAFNQPTDTFFVEESKQKHFLALWEHSKYYLQKTRGVLDPSLFPLFEFYGDGYKAKQALSKKDTVIVQTLLKLKLLDSMSIQTNNVKKKFIVKPNKAIRLNFAAIKTGYIIDQLAIFLNKNKVKNYLIEVQGKCKTKGVGPDRKDWSYAINKTNVKSGGEKKELSLRIANKSLATSGSQTSDLETARQRFAHVVDPISGMSRLSDILSVTVIAEDCVSADAYATAFINMGLSKSLEAIKTLKNVDACFVHDEEGDGDFEYTISEGFSKYYYDNEQKSN
jgi:FAD:protein FMN transferase